jgi:hypothetical protein
MGQISHGPNTIAGAVDGGVVDDDQSSVTRIMHVELDTLDTQFHGRRKGGRRVFWIVPRISTMSHNNSVFLRRYIHDIRPVGARPDERFDHGRISS